MLLPAALPYMFTGFRLSLGIAWLVIVAAEMLTGRARRRRLSLAGIQRLIYEHIILCILTIGFVGFVLDRLMGLVEKRLAGGVSHGLLSKLPASASHSVEMRRATRVLDRLTLRIEHGEFVSSSASRAPARRRSSRSWRGCLHPIRAR